MNCTKIEKLLPLYTEGDLSEREMLSVSAHLSSCDFCRNLSAEFAASQERLHNFAVPDFGAEFYAELRGAVMKEISESSSPSARPSIFQSLFTLFPQRQAMAASLATLALFGLVSFALYFSLARSETTLTAIEPSAAKFNPVMLPENGAGPAKDEVRRNSAEVRQLRPIVAGTLRRRSKPETTTAARPESPAPESIDNASSAVAQTNAVPRDEASGQAVARMDIQTSDPNIRIIWLARKAGE